MALLDLASKVQTAVPAQVASTPSWITPAVVIGVLIAVCMVGLVLEVRRDGYGRTPPPRSHPLDEFDPATKRVPSPMIQVARPADAARPSSTKSPAVWASVVQRVVGARLR